jgi:hypothetical protein
MTDYLGSRRKSPGLGAEVEVPCVSRRVVIGVFFIPEIRISLILYSESIMYVFLVAKL